MFNLCLLGISCIGIFISASNDFTGISTSLPPSFLNEYIHIPYGISKIWKEETGNNVVYYIEMTRIINF